MSVARQVDGRRVDLTTFVGRGRDLAVGRRLLGVSRLVTLVGPGGVGKTRLARRLADDVARAYPDGTYLLELAELNDPGALASELVGTFGVEVITRSPEAAVAAFVRDRRLLLVLDNCEHLIEACARLVHALLQASPGLHIVATSRQPLGVTGEQLMSVEPLSLPSPGDVRRDGLPSGEAVELLLDRARLVVPGFEVTETNAELAGKLCTVLDGMPLAIELAAARLRVLTLAQLADRLRDRFGVLKIATAALPRQQTLRASVDWSYDLCSPEEQKLWAWMSAFEGGADLDAVEAICAGTGVNAFDIVAGLVDKSVLTPQEVAGRVRYRMLDTIRAYGRDRLVERGEADDVTERHRTYFVEFADRASRSWFGRGQRDLLARTVADYANVRAAFDSSLRTPATHGDALAIATSIWWFWVARGITDEGNRWFVRALAERQDEGPMTLRALARASFVAALRSDRPSARDHAQAALAIHVADESDEVRSHRRQARATLAVEAGDLDRAIEEDREALRQEAQVSRLGAEEAANVHLRLAVRLAWTGRHAEALSQIEAARALCAEHGDEWYLSYVFYLKGRSLADLGDHEQALHAEREALRLGRGGFDSYTVVNALEVLTQVFSSLDQAPSAAVLLGAINSIWPEIGASRLAGDEPAHAAREQHARDLLGDEEFTSAFARGGRMTAEEVISFVLDEPVAKPPPEVAPTASASPLTKREVEVAELVARGLSNKEIAEVLVISPRTAEGHVARLLDKLGFTTRASVAVWVAERRAARP